MKIRLDFVTNSSSSSFVCMGVNKDDIKIADEVYLKLFEDEIKKSWCSLSKEEIADMTEEDKIEYIKDDCDYDGIFNKGNICIGGSDYDFVGVSIPTLLDQFKDVKLGDIKKVVAEEINKEFGTSLNEKDISYYEEGWYDG